MMTRFVDWLESGRLASKPRLPLIAGCRPLAIPKCAGPSGVGREGMGKRETREWSFGDGKAAAADDE